MAGIRTGQGDLLCKTHSSRCPASSATKRELSIRSCPGSRPAGTTHPSEAHQACTEDPSEGACHHQPRASHPSCTTSSKVSSTDHPIQTPRRSGPADSAGNAMTGSAASACGLASSGAAASGRPGNVASACSKASSASPPSATADDGMGDSPRSCVCSKSRTSTRAVSWVSGTQGTTRPVLSKGSRHCPQRSQPWACASCSGRTRNTV